LPRLGQAGTRGDILASLEVELPDELSDRQKELFEELRGTGV
jgi:DnaJ-class molecular chaperone